MGIQIISLSDLLEVAPDLESVNNILKTFKSIPHPITGQVNDVEYFLHQKAIEFEKAALATTHLLFSSYKDKSMLVGYFSLANKSLIMSKKIITISVSPNKEDCVRMVQKLKLVVT